MKKVVASLGRMDLAGKPYEQMRPGEALFGTVLLSVLSFGTLFLTAIF